jgi:hypothetical protein
MLHVLIDAESSPVAADDPRWADYLATDPPRAVREADEAYRALGARGPKPPDARFTDPVKVAAAIAAREAEHARDLADAARACVVARDDARAATSLDPLWGSIATLTVWAVRDGEPVNEPETAIGEVAALDMLANVCETSPPDARFCGWNTAGFDIPFARSRAILTGHRLRDVLPPIAKRIGDYVDDLMLLWPHAGRYGTMIAQRNVARALGLPRQEHSGRDVAALLDAGNIDAVVAHNRADVRELLAIGRAMGVL